MNKREFTCISCPLGCHLELTESQGSDLPEVTGNLCQRGIDFAREEFRAPRRVLTTVVSISGSNSLLPVISAAPIPKEKLLASLEYLKRIKVKTPVTAGDVLVENILETQVSIVAAKTVE